MGESERSNGSGRHVLRMPWIANGSHRSRSVHETGALVTCGGCGRAFVLIESDAYARLLARAISGPQKGPP